MSKINEIIKTLELEPLPREGGLFRSTYRSKEKIDGKDIGSAILYMLTGQAYSHLHRLPTDEIYHFYSGDPVELLELLPDGSFKKVILGGDILNGQKVQYVARAGVWQGSKLIDGGQYALMGTTMSPGFDERDYEHGNPKELIEKYPEAKDLILKLTGETKSY